MRSLILTLVTLINVNAQVPVGSIENFSLDYKDPSGSAVSSLFNFDRYQLGKNVRFSVEKQAGSFYLETPNELIEVSNIPEMLKELIELKIKSLSLVSNQQDRSLTIKDLNGSSSEHKLKLSNLLLKCIAKEAPSDLVHNLLDSCFNTKGNMKMQSIYYLKAYGKETRVSDLYINVNKNKLNLSVKLSGKKIKILGKSYFADNTIRLRLDKIKTGILNVKGLVFKELKKLESENFIVSKPWIEIKID